MFQMNGRTTGFRPQTRKYYRTRLLQKKWLSRTRLANDKAALLQVAGWHFQTQHYSVFLVVCLFVCFFANLAKKISPKRRGTLLRLSTNMDGATSTENQQSRHLVIVTFMFSLGSFIYFLNFNCTCISKACEENVFWFIFVRTVAWPGCEQYNSE